MEIEWNADKERLFQSIVADLPARSEYVREKDMATASKMMRELADDLDSGTQRIWNFNMEIVTDDTFRFEVLIRGKNSYANPSPPPDTDGIMKKGL